MDEEEEDEESGHQFVAHGSMILVVLESPEEVAHEGTQNRKQKVKQRVDVEALEGATY